MSTKSMKYKFSRRKDLCSGEKEPSNSRNFIKTKACVLQNAFQDKGFCFLLSPKRKKEIISTDGINLASIHKGLNINTLIANVYDKV